MTDKLNIPLAAITTEGFLSRFSFGMINFAVPLYALSLGMSLSEVGLLVSLRLGIGLALTPLAATAADAFGRKRLLLGGLAARALVPLLFMLAAVPWHLLAIRMVHGASTAARDPSASSLLADHADEGRLASAFAWQSTARHVGGTLGAAAAGVLIGLSGSNFDVVFGAAFALSALPLLLTAALVTDGEEERTAAETQEYVEPPPWRERLAAWRAEMLAEAIGARTWQGSQPKRFWQRQKAVSLVTNSPPTAKPVPVVPEEPPAEPIATEEPQTASPGPRLLPLAFMGLAITSASHMIHGLFPVLATEYAGLSPAEAGAVYTASGLIVLAAGPGFGWLADRMGTKPVLLIRSVANVVSSLLYLGAPGLGGMTAGHVTDDLGKAAFRPAWGATMATVAAHDRKHRTRRLALIDTGREGGETFAPLVGAFIWDVWGITALLLARIGVAVAAEIYTLALSLRLRPGALAVRLRPRAPSLRLRPRAPSVRLRPGDARRYLLRMAGLQANGAELPHCAFCGVRCGGFETVTTRDLKGAWRHDPLPVCLRCKGSLPGAGKQGLLAAKTNGRRPSAHAARLPQSEPPSVASANENGRAPKNGRAVKPARPKQHARRDR